jgi:hypothetical protein
MGLKDSFQRRAARKAAAGPASRGRSLAADIPVGAEWIAAALGASGYAADFSVASLREVDRFVAEQSGPGGLLSQDRGGRLFALGCYVGQTLIKAYGGVWETDDADPQGEVNIAVRLDSGVTVWPVQRLMKLYAEGPDNALYPFAVSLAASPPAAG